MNGNDLTIGCHLSAAGGYFHMAKEAVSLGANTFQFFTRNPRGGKAKDIDPDDLLKFEEYCRDSGIEVFLAHAPYTLNAASKDARTRAFAIDTLADDLFRMTYTPGQMYNMHPGCHVGQGADVGIDLIVDAILRAFDLAETKCNEAGLGSVNCKLLLETMAGKGSEVGRSFEEIRSIVDGVRVGSDGAIELGVCMDTCHVFDGGYDIVGDLDGVIEKFDKVVGLDRLCALHLNDSKNEAASHKDRHEQIGKGHIGCEAFESIVNSEALCHLPMYLETPHDDMREYAAEIEMIRRFVK